MQNSVLLPLYRSTNLLPLYRSSKMVRAIKITEINLTPVFQVPADKPIGASERDCYAITGGKQHSFKQSDMVSLSLSGYQTSTVYVSADYMLKHVPQPGG